MGLLVLDPRALQQYPEKVAVRFGSRPRTFREVTDRVARLAGAPQRVGMEEGDRTAMPALNSDRYLEYLMAAPWGARQHDPALRLPPRAHRQHHPIRVITSIACRG